MDPTEPALAVCATILGCFLRLIHLHPRKNPDTEDADVDQGHENKRSDHQSLSLLAIVQNDTNSVGNDLEQALCLDNPEQYCFSQHDDCGELDVRHLQMDMKK